MVSKARTAVGMVAVLIALAFGSAPAGCGNASEDQTEKAVRPSVEQSVAPSGAGGEETSSTSGGDKLDKVEVPVPPAP